MPLLQISSSCDLCIAHNVHSLNLFALEPPEFVPTSQKFNYPMVSSSDSATHIFLKKLTNKWFPWCSRNISWWNILGRTHLLNSLQGRMMRTPALQMMVAPVLCSWMWANTQTIFFTMKSHSRRKMKQQSKILRSLPLLINAVAVPGWHELFKNFYG